MKIWLNGTILDESVARLSPLDRGFLLADGVFETVLSEGGRMCRLRAHLHRMAAGAEAFSIPFFWKASEIAQAVDGLRKANALGNARLAVRLTLSRGPGLRGLGMPEPQTPTLLITVTEAPAKPETLSLQVVSVRRNEHSPTSRLKTLNYGDSLFARREAEHHGAEEALMLNSAGFVACAAAGNIWILDDGVARTPSLDQGVLPGIVRGDLLRLLPDFGFAVTEGPLSLDKVRSAHEVFVTNSLIGVCPVAALNQRRIGIERIKQLRPVLEAAMLQL